MHVHVTRRRRALSFLLVMAMCVALLPVMPAAAVPPPLTTIYVDPVGGDDANTGASEAEALETLASAIDASDPGSTIVLLPGTHELADAIMLPWQLDFVGRDGASETTITLAGDMGMFDIDSQASGTAFEGIAFVGASNVAHPGGAITVLNAGLTLTECVFTDNWTPVGGAVFAGGADLQIIDSVFDRNGDETTTTPFGATEMLDRICYEGGAVFAEASGVTITGSTFTDNGAYYIAPAVMCSGSEAMVSDTTFDHNQVTQWFDTVVPLPNGSFTFEGVSAQAPGPMSDDSGALTFADSYAMVERCEFSENLAYAGAGILASGGSVSIHQSEFRDNITYTGAAAFGALLEPPRVEEFKDNVTFDAPSRVSPLRAMPQVVDRSLFTGTTGGGAVLTFTGEGGSVTNSQFVHNGVPGDEPDLYTVIGTVGGAPVPNIIIDLVDPVDVYNCTIADNSAGTGVFGLDAPVDVINSIVWNGLGLDSVVTVGDVMGCDLETDIPDFSAPPSGPGASFVVGYISAYPEFVDPDAGDYRLKPFSPCIDTGTDVVSEWVVEDYDGVMRPIDGDEDEIAQWDIGAFEYDPWSDTRIGGSDRFDTSVEVSQRHFPAGAGTVILATGMKFADGLAAAGLAGEYDAPLLLTDRDELPGVVADEIVRLGASDVIIVGGPDAVTEDVADEVAALGEIAVDRIGGEDRYETAAMIAEEILALEGDGFSGMFLIARGDLFADALTASPVAYANHIPILLVAPDELPEATVDVIRAAGAERAIIVGGKAAVQPKVAAQVASMVASNDRIDGTDRYDTSANFCQWAYDNELADWASVGIATGEKFPDALSGGAGIGSRGGLVMLTPRASVHASIQGKLTDVGINVDSLEVFGGEGAVTADVYDTLIGLVNP